VFWLAHAYVGDTQRPWSRFTFSIFVMASLSFPTSPPSLYYHLPLFAPFPAHWHARWSASFSFKFSISGRRMNDSELTTWRTADELIGL
jgi:hypothetical protein